MAKGPTVADMLKFYPTEAMIHLREGQAVIKCSVASDLALKDCAVVSEEPLGFQFGAAALKLSRLFKMKPTTPDGQSVTGTEVTIPLAFKLAPIPISLSAFDKLPSTADILKVYPHQAIDQGKEGDVVLQCVGHRDGAVDRCTVWSQAPDGLGFGDAALQLAQFIHLKPNMAVGEVLAVPIKFRLAR